MSGLKLVIFDVDGTLIDSQAHITHAMNAAFDVVGLDAPSRDNVLGIVGLSLPQAMIRLVPDASDHERSKLVEAYKHAFMSHRASSPPSPLYPGARDQLEALMQSEEMLVGIATGKSRRGLDAVLDSLDLTGRFVTEQVADHHPSKPHPSMVLTAMSETGCLAEDTVMIGDTSFDIEMGRAAGAKTVGVSWGYHTELTLKEARADEIIHDFNGLPGALAGLLNR